MIEIIREFRVGYYTQIPIYHSDGTFLATIKGNRSFPNEERRKEGVTMEKYKDLTICKMNNKTVFEIH